eukprot:GHVT01042634.1.p1 GENE.GHVT01042634.1~~GHVT01042634.1.p1  ORF type:complete len:381 (-),score=58.75 GHVT01042634.1:582-1724(-)
MNLRRPSMAPAVFDHVCDLRFLLCLKALGNLIFAHPCLRLFCVSSARVSLVNEHHEVLFDEYVRPTRQVTSYRTWISGITKADLEKGISFKAAQLAVLEIVNNKVLVGHALKNDLEVLRISHPLHLARDTSVYRPLREGLNPKGSHLPTSTQPPSLRRLVAHWLKEAIQEGTHDSVEDAMAAMRLYQLKQLDWENRFEAVLKNSTKQHLSTCIHDDGDDFFPYHTVVARDGRACAPETPENQTVPLKYASLSAGRRSPAESCHEESDREKLASCKRAPAQQILPKQNQQDQEHDDQYEDLGYVVSSKHAKHLTPPTRANARTPPGGDADMSCPPTAFAEETRGKFNRGGDGRHTGGRRTGRQSSSGESAYVRAQRKWGVE